MTGKEAYTEDCRRCPYYVGSHILRRPWDDLSAAEQASWNDNPHPRDYTSTPLGER